MAKRDNVLESAAKSFLNFSNQAGQGLASAVRNTARNIGNIEVDLPEPVENTLRGFNRASSALGDVSTFNPYSRQNFEQTSRIGRRLQTKPLPVPQPLRAPIRFLGGIQEGAGQYGVNTIGNIEQGSRDISQGRLVPGAMKIGSGAVQLGMGASAVGAPGSSAVLGAGSSLLSGGFGALQGKDFASEAGRAFPEGFKIGGVTRFTDPLIGAAATRFAPQTGLLGRQLATRGITGIGNVGEDLIIAGLSDGLEGIKKGLGQSLQSFSVGALLGGNEEIFDQFRRKANLTPQEAKQVKQFFEKTRRDGTTYRQPVGPGGFGKAEDISIPKAGGGTINLTEQSQFPSQGRTGVRYLRSGEAVDQGTGAAFGLTGGIEVETDEDGNITDFSYNPTKGAVGALVVGGLKTKQGREAAEKATKYAFNINKPKLGVTGKAAEKIDTVVKQIKPALEEVKGKPLTEKEIIKGGLKANMLEGVLPREQTKQFAEALQASRNFLKTEAGNAGLSQEFVDQLRFVSSAAADAGRRLRSFGVDAQETSLKESVVKDLIKLGKTADELAEAGRNVDWNDAKQVTEFYRKFKKADVSDLLDEFRYTNMLTSPNTHINNFFSNFLQTGIVAPVEKEIAGAADWVRSALTSSERQFYSGQGVDYAKGYIKALPDAFNNAKLTLQGRQAIENLDLRSIPSGNKFMQVYSFPLRALEAGDQFFKTLVTQGELSSLKRAGETGADALKKAEQSAEYRLFRQAFDPEGKLGQNVVLQQFDKWNSAISNLRRLPGGKWIVPFIRTPTNILKQGIEYSPLGITTVPGARNAAEQLSKTILGSAVFAGAYQLARAGLSTWETPTNAQERQEFYDAGLQPYSLKIGDKWYSYSKLGPLSYPIAIAAAMNWAEEKGADESKMKQLGEGAAGFMKFFADQSYVQNIGNVVDALRGDEYAVQDLIGNVPSQLLPYRSLQGWMARLVDDTYRKAYGDNIPETILNEIKAQVPFLSKTVPPYTTSTGEPSKRQFPLINAFSPIRVSQEKEGQLQTYLRGNELRDARRREREMKTAVEKAATGEEIDTKLMAKNNRLTKERVKYGLDVSTAELQDAYLGDALEMKAGTRYQKEKRDSDLFSKISQIENNEYLTQQQKETLYTQIAGGLGISRRDIDYYQVAGETVDLKTAYVVDQAQQAQSREQFLQMLASGRRKVNGKLVVSDGVINNLEDEGYLSDAEAKALKKIDYNNDGTLKASSSRGRKPKKFNITPVSPPKIRTVSTAGRSTVPQGIRLKKFRSL